MNKTGIEYLDFTSNPIVGCDMSLPCAERCWARRMARRLRAQGRPQYQDVVDAKGNWTGKTAFVEEVLKALLRRKKPATVGLCFMADAFHQSVPDEWLDRLLAVCALTPQIQYILPTKRAQRMRKYLTAPELMARWGYWASHAIHVRDGGDAARAAKIAEFNEPRFPLRNLALMLSASNQAELDARADDFLATPAALYILSLEPLVGAVEVSPWLTIDCPTCDGWAETRHGNSCDACGNTGEIEGFNWLIVGGESGPGARPMPPDWARSARDQCVAADVPFMFKQWGGFRPVGCADPDSDDHETEAALTANEDRTILVYHDGHAESGDEPPTEMDAWFMEPVGKKAAGRLLDGKIWDERPEGWR